MADLNCSYTILKSLFTFFLIEKKILIIHLSFATIKRIV
jgi:hypothetical protein